MPSDAPFTPEQRAWLNGFFAGIFSHEPIPSPASPEKQTLTVAVASQTGTGDALARTFAREAKGRGFTVTTTPVDQLTLAELAGAQTLLLIASTHGEGEPPDSALGFYRQLYADDVPRLDGLCFAVLALGDSNYEQFAKCGRDFDVRLAALGAQRLIERVDCDGDVDEPFARWKTTVFATLEKSTPADAQRVSTDEALPSSKPSSNGTSGRQAVIGRLVINRNLCGYGSAKETRHVVFAAGAPSPTYEPGDALGVAPHNCPHAVEALLAAAGFSGAEPCRDHGGETVPLGIALRERYAIGKLTAPVLRKFAERARNTRMLALFEPGQEANLRAFLWGRDLIDLFDLSHDRLPAGDLVAILPKLAPRLYSIASSPRAHPGEFHLTVAAVRYRARERERFGVCSTFIADRIGRGNPAAIYVQPNTHFRLPSDGARPIIMVGPGTGIAPFRAFLTDRQTTGCTGKNWLFFGEQHEATDFLYRDELDDMVASGHLTALHTAFSRDQAERIYVQRRMLEHGRTLYGWLEDGAHLYVCGDASRMAKDVDATLHTIVAEHSGRSHDDVEGYIEQLRNDGRYQRDVY